VGNRIIDIVNNPISAEGEIKLGKEWKYGMG
jgi:hypothetical protein